MIKNNYPLPLILDVLENIRTKKVFTKMDLRWSYNNMKIKEGDVLRDLINTRKMVVFIDDVIVGTEAEEGHDEIVAEVIKRLEENNLYVKPKKYK